MFSAGEILDPGSIGGMDPGLPFSQPGWAAPQEGVFASVINSPGCLPAAGAQLTAGAAGQLTAANADCAATAGSGAWLTVDRPQRGRLEATGDHDRFRVQLLAGHQYGFEVTGKSLADPTLALRSRSGELLEFNDNSRGLDPAIYFSPLQTEFFFLDVGGFDGLTGTYLLDARDLTPADDFASSIRTSGRLKAGRTSQGAIEAAGDADWFRTQLRAGRSMVISAEGLSLADPTVILRDRRGAVVDVAARDGEGSSSISINPDKDGSYFVEVRGMDPFATGTYRLQINSPVISDDYGSTATTAGHLEPNSAITGLIERRRDRDWFAIQLEADALYSFSFAAGTLNDPRLILRDGSGRRLINPGEDRLGNRELLFTPLTSGQYYLDCGGDGVGGYTLSAVRIATATDLPDDFSSDSSTTGVAPAGESMVGTIESSGDADWFRVDLLANRTYDFRLTGETLGDPFLTLIDPAGERLRFSNDDQDKNSKITFRTAQAGIYFLEARAADAGTGRYRLMASPRIGLSSIDTVSAGTGTTETLSSNINGIIDTSGDRDWYRTELFTGYTYQFFLYAANPLFADLTLRDSSGTIVVNALQPSPGSRTTQLAFLPKTSGTYFIDVGAANKVDIGGFSLVKQLSAASDEYASSFLSPQSEFYLPVGQISVGGQASGALQSSSDVDWFQCNLQANQSYRFRAQGVNLVDPALELLSLSRTTFGTRVVTRATRIAFNDDYNALNPEIRFTVPTTGSYVLAISNSTSTVNNASLGTGTYLLSADIISALGSNDDWSADTSSRGVLSLNKPLEAVVNFINDRDWFAIAMEAGKTYGFSLTGKSLPDPTLSLIDSGGRQVLASNDNLPNTSNAGLLFRPTSSGTYYIEARSATAAAAGLTGNYVLQCYEELFGGLEDPGIATFINSALSDRLLSRKELTALLRQAGLLGVTASEFKDLKTIAGRLRPYLSSPNADYDNYIFNAVVNGNPANKSITLGGPTAAPLGNLAAISSPDQAASSQAQMQSLIAKWYEGADLPRNLIGGDTAAGTSAQTFSYATATGSLFVDDINFDDVNQGRAGTCYLLAAAAGLANNRKAAIRSMFCDNGDGTYGVRFYDNATGSPIWVTVNRQIPVDTDGKTPLLASNSGRSLSGELWVSLLEKAYAQANEIGAFRRAQSDNSYAAIEGGFSEPLSQITGRACSYYDRYELRRQYPTDYSTRWTQIKGVLVNALSSGATMWLGCDTSTYQQVASGYVQTFVRGHAFAITAYDALSDQFTIVNPWGQGGTWYFPKFTASWTDLYRFNFNFSWLA